MNKTLRNTISEMLAEIGDRLNHDGWNYIMQHDEADQSNFQIAIIIEGIERDISFLNEKVICGDFPTGLEFIKGMNLIRLTIEHDFTSEQI